MVNNLRDIDTDPAHGKRTLAVRLGDERARTAFVVMVCLPVVLGVGAVAWVQLERGLEGGTKNRLHRVRTYGMSVCASALSHRISSIRPHRSFTRG